MTFATQVLDASALIVMFRGHWKLDELLDDAQRGATALLLPTCAIADAEAVMQAEAHGWEAILLTRGVRSMELTEHAALDIGVWPGSLTVRHVVHEAQSVRATVVTCQPAAYDGFQVPLLVV